jgi:hypothetical protein
MTVETPPGSVTINSFGKGQIHMCQDRAASLLDGVPGFHDQGAGRIQDRLDRVVVQEVRWTTGDDGAEVLSG